MNIKFREALIDDLPWIIEIYNSTIPGRMVTADTEMVTVESKRNWFEEHNEKTRPLWVVTDSDVIIGWVSFQSFYGRPAYDATAEISIYLHETKRGKGYGKLILQYAMQNCGSLGIKTLLGYIFAHNRNSLSLFRKMGFEDWGQLHDIAVLDKIERSLIIVGKRINK